MVHDFVYAQPVKIYFGPGKRGELQSILDELAVERCLLVCDPYFTQTAEELRKQIPAIRAVFSGVEPNPQLSGVEEAVRMAREQNVQAVIGLGGGSSLDTAKFAAAAAKGNQTPAEYYQGAPFPRERLAIITIPTTAGTGSEVTQVSVISRGSEKKTINHPAFMPSAALVDPELTLSVPPQVTMHTGLDALAHALEGYWSKHHQPICDLMAVEAVRIILANIERAYTCGSDLEARTAMSCGALLGGLAFALPKTAASHACSYPLSSDYHLPHGEACAFTLDSLVKINADERLESLCRRVGLRNTNALAEKIADLKKLGGLKSRLSQLGTVDIDKLAADCAAHPLMNNNPVPMDQAAVKAMFEGLR